MLHKLKIGKRLAVSYGIILLLLLIVGFSGYWGLHSVADKTVKMLNTDGELLENSTEAYVAVLNLRRVEKDIFLSIRTPEKMIEHAETWNKHYEALAIELDEMREGAFIQSEKEKAQALSNGLEKYKESLSTVFAGIKSGVIKSPEAANEAMQSSNGEMLTFIADVEKFVFDANKRMKSVKTIVSEQENKTAIIMFSFVAISILVAFFIGLKITRSITTPLQNAVALNTMVASGDLTVEFKSQSNDEVGQLLSAIGATVNSLRTMIGQIQTAADALHLIAENLLQANTKVVDVASIQAEGVSNTSSAIMEINASIRSVSDSVSSLSVSATKSASAILEMTSSVEEVSLNTETLERSVSEVSSSISQMAASISQVNASVSNLLEVATSTTNSVIELDFSIKQVEKSAADATQISATVRQDAEIGRRSLNESITGIREIKRSAETTFEVMNALSQKTSNIGAILSVIDDVAEQTNLLALNAAIIAAQAGEHGKGFSVVAEEIKQLAERTRNSTREITLVIKGVQDETALAVTAMQSARTSIETGEILADKSVSALNKIFEGVQKSTDQMQEIARATLEQSKGSQQIRNAVELVFQMVGQIDTATKEQTQGSKLIITSAERMKNITAQVMTATQEQSKAGKFIAASTESISGLISHINGACSEQKCGGEMIVASVENIRISSGVNIEAIKVMDESVTLLFKQIEVLRGEIKTFTL